MFGGDNRLLAIFDIEVIDEKIDAFMDKLRVMQGQIKQAGERVQMFGQSTAEAGQNAKETSGQFGKMFGIGMNILFLGMALNMVFGRMARNMLKMTGASAALSAGLQSVLLPFFLAITPMILKLSQAMMNLPREVKMVIGAFVGLMTVLGPLLMMAGQIALLAISGLSLGMIATAAGAVAGALAILVAGFKLGMAIGREFGGVVRTVMDIVITSVKVTISGIVQLFNGLMQAFNGLITTFSGLAKGDLSKVLTGIEMMFAGMKNQVVGIFKLLFSGVISYLKNLAPNAYDAAVNMMDSFKSGIKSIGSEITDAFMNVLPAPLGAAIQGISAFSGSLIGGIQDVLTPNDFILTSGGKMIQPDKRDTIIGAKPGGPIMEGANGGGQVTVNINDPVMKEDVDVQRVVDEVEDRVNRDTRGRSGGLT